MSWWSLIPMMFSGGGQKPLAMGGGPRGLPMGTPLSVSGQPIQVGPPNGQLVQGAVATPPTGAAPLIPPPGGIQPPPPIGTESMGMAPQQPMYPNGTGNGTPFSGVSPADSAAMATAGVTLAGEASKQTLANETGSPIQQGTEEPVNPSEEKDDNMLGLILSLASQNSGQHGLAPGAGPKGMQQSAVKQMKINPQTGLIEWV